MIYVCFLFQGFHRYFMQTFNGTNSKYQTLDHLINLLIFRGRRQFVALLAQLFLLHKERCSSDSISSLCCKSEKEKIEKTRGRSKYYQG